jgi:hypothetical protein
MLKQYNSELADCKYLLETLPLSMQLDIKITTEFRMSFNLKALMKIYEWLIVNRLVDFARVPMFLEPLRVRVHSTSQRVNGKSVHYQAQHITFDLGLVVGRRKHNIRLKLQSEARSRSA